MKTKKGFTLIELLVVVLIIGILASIAVPQYQKAVLKADLHRGVALVESLYQAQQAYYLTHGDFAGDIDELDISIPKDSSCTKGTKGTEITTSWYDCDFGRVWNDKYSVQFQNRPTKEEFKGKKIAYTHYFKDYDDDFKAGKRFCFAGPQNKTAQDACQNIGGIYLGEGSSWIYYEIK